MADNDNRVALYNALKDDYDIGTQEEFNASISDRKNSDALFNAIKDDYDVGESAEEFYNTLNPAPIKEPVEEPGFIDKAKGIAVNAIGAMQNAFTLSEQPQPQSIATEDTEATNDKKLEQSFNLLKSAVNDMSWQTSGMAFSNAEKTGVLDMDFKTFKESLQSQDKVDAYNEVMSDYSNYFNKLNGIIDKRNKERLNIINDYNRMVHMMNKMQYDQLTDTDKKRIIQERGDKAFPRYVNGRLKDYVIKLNPDNPSDPWFLTKQGEIVAVVGENGGAGFMSAEESFKALVRDNLDMMDILSEENDFDMNKTLNAIVQKLGINLGRWASDDEIKNTKAYNDIVQKNAGLLWQQYFPQSKFANDLLTEGKQRALDTTEAWNEEMRKEKAGQGPVNNRIMGGDNTSFSENESLNRKYDPERKGVEQAWQYIDTQLKAKGVDEGMRKMMQNRFVDDMIAEYASQHHSLTAIDYILKNIVKDNYAVDFVNRSIHTEFQNQIQDMARMTDPNQNIATDFVSGLGTMALEMPTLYNPLSAVSGWAVNTGVKGALKLLPKNARYIEKLVEFFMRGNAMTRDEALVAAEKWWTMKLQDARLYRNAVAPVSQALQEGGTFGGADAIKGFLRGVSNDYVWSDPIPTGTYEGVDELGNAKYHQNKGIWQETWHSGLKGSLIGAGMGGLKVPFANAAYGASGLKKLILNTLGFEGGVAVMTGVDWAAMNYKPDTENSVSEVDILVKNENERLMRNGQEKMTSAEEAFFKFQHIMNSFAMNNATLISFHGRQVRDFLFKSRYTQEDIRHAIMEENQRRQGMLKFATTEEERAACRPMTADQEGLFIKQMGFTDGDGNLKSEYHLLDLVGNMKRNIMEMNRTGYFERTMRFTDSDKALLNRLDPRLLTAMEDISLYASDLSGWRSARQEANAAKIINSITEFCADQRIPQQLITKLMYRFTGRIFSPGMVDATEIVDDAGRYTVRAYSADGRLIDSLSYDTPEEAGKAEMRYNSQKEYVAIQKNAYSILGEEINRNFYKWLVEDYSKIDGTWLASAYGDSEDGYAVDYEKRLEALLQGRERKLTLLQESVARVMNAIQKHTDPRAVCPDDYNYVVNEYSNRCTSLRDIRRKVAEKMGVDEGLVLQAIEGRKIDEAKYLDKNYIEVGDNIYRTQQDQKIVDAYLEELKMRNEATQQSAQETGTNIEALKTELKSFLSAGEGATPVLNRMLVEKNLAEQTLRGMGIDPEEAKAIAIDTHRSAEERMTAQQYLNAKEGLEAISETISEMTESATEDKRTLADMIENVSITDETPMEKIITATFGGQPVYVWKGDPAADGLLILKDKDGNIVTDANGRQEIPSDAVENPTAMTKAEFLAPYERSARVQYQSALGNAQFGINVAKGETITDKDGTEHTVIDIQEDADKDGRPVTMVVLGNNGETTSTVSLLDAVKMRNEGIKAQIERENTAIAERMRLEEEAAQKREEEAALEQASPEATVTTETPAPDTPQTPQIPEEPAGPRILQRLPTTEDGKYDYTQMTPEEAVSFLNGETIENNTNRVGRRAGYANDIAKQELDMALKALAKLRENAVKGANQAERDASLTTAEKDAKYLEETINFWGKVLNEAGKRQSQDESFTGVFDTLESYELARKSPETYEWMNRLAQSLGYKVGLIDSRSRAELSNTKNGKNDLGKKTIWLNMYDAGIDITPEGKRLTYRQYVGQVFGHELTHTFFSRNRRMLNDFIAKTKTYLGDEAWGQKIEQKIREYLKRSTYNDIYSRADLSAEEKREMALNAIKTQYGVDYTNGLGYIEEEIACDMAGQFFGDGNGEYMRHLAMGDFPRPTDKSIPVKEEQESTSRVNNFMAWVWNKIEGLFRADEAVDEPTSRDMRAEQREELMQTYANVFDAMRKEMAESHSKNNDLRIEEAKKQERLAAEAAERNRILEQEKKEKDAVFEPYEKIVTDVRNAVDDCKSLDAKIRKAKEMLYGYEEALMELDDMEPQTLEEYVSNIGSRVLAWEDKDVNGHTVRGLKTELGLKRGVTGSDTTGINDFLAKNGEGKGIDEYVHSLWEGLPENLRHYNDTDVKAALLDVLSASTSAKDTREMTGRNRLTRALNIFEDSIMRDAEADYDSKYVMVNGRMMPRTPGEIEADAISEEMSQDSSQPMPFSLRQEPAPKRRKYGYKAFKLGKDGKLYPPMVDNPGGDATPVGLFLNADAGVRAGKSATGREKVGQRGGGSLSFRPAWHLGYQPNAKQFYGRGENEGKAKGDIVWALVEFDATNDYSFEADAFGLNKNGTWQHSYMGCPYIPENGYYEMRTNPNPSTDAWALSGAMRVIHMLSRAEEADVLSRSGVQKPELYTEDVLTDDVVARINREIDSNLRQNMGDDEYINMKDAISKVMKMNFEEMHDYVYEDTESDYVGEKHNPTLDELRAVRSDEDAERAYRYYQIIRRGGDDAETLRRMIDEQKSAIINEESDAVKNRLKRAQKAWYEEKSKELETMSNADLHESVNIDEPSPERDIVILDEKGEFKSSTNSETGQALFSLRTFDEDGRETLDEFLRAQVGRGVLTEDDAKEIGTAMEKIYEDAMKIYDSGEYETFNDWSMQPIKVTKDGSVIYSVIKPNAEYGMNLDFSLICKKRRTLDAVLNQMTERGLIDMLPSSNDDISIAIINDIIREYGFETACKLCFVDAKRFRQAKVADDFVQLYNGLVKSMIPRGSKIKANYFDFAGEGRESVDDVIALDKISDDLISFDKLKKVMQSNGDATVMYKVAKYLLENPSERRLLQRSDFMGSKGFDAVTKYSQEKGAEIDERRRQAGEEVKSNEKSIRGLYNSKKGSGGPKSSESDIQYLNDVAKANWKPEKAFAVGGVRVQSFSDFVPHMVFDYAQMFAELAAGKLPAHAYTKEELFVKMFGKTGIKINMSLVPKVVEDGIAAGLDKDGNYVWDINRDENGNIIQAESFDYDEAVRIQNDPAYRNNCGTIAVGVSDAHIRKMLLDPNIRMVIPYHASGINKKVAVHNGINRFTDYTNTQNTRYADTGKKLSKADHAKEKGFNVYLKECGDPTKAVDAYIKDCKKKGWIPKFDQFLDKEYKEDGAYKDKDGKRYDYKQSEGYYKLLEDYTTYIPDGKGGFEYHPQEALKFELPKEGDTFGSFGELMRRGLSEDEAVEAKRTNEVSPIVDEIERRLKTNGTVRESVREDVPAIKEGESLMDYSKRVSEWREEKKDERFSNRVANSDPFMRIFDSVNYTAKNLVTKLSVTNDNTALGKHEWGGDLSLNLNALSQTCYSSGDIAETLLHEMIHRVTSYAIRLYDKDNGKYRNLLSEGQRQAVKELKSLLGKLKSHPEAFAEGADTYGLSKEAETIAETARLKFRRETNMAQLYEDGILKSLWNAIKRFFHLPADELYSKRMERIIKMIAQDYNAQLYDFYGNKTTPDHLMNETRYSGRGSNGRYSIRQRQGESDEEFALRQDETLRSRQMNLDGEQARKMVIAEIKNAIDSKMATNMIKSDLNRLLARVQQATPENVLTVARMVQNDARDVQTRMLGLQLYQLMNLKTQDRNGKNMSIAKNVSNDVRVVLDNIKGRMYGVMHTDADEAMGRLRSENRRITEEIRRARLEMEREHYQEGTTEYDNAMNFIRELEAKIEANKTSIKELDAKKEETIRQNLTTGEGDLQKQLDALEQHAEDCADPDNPAVWTAEDNQKYATLEILKQRLDIETTDAQIRDFEEQKRNATNAGQRRALESVIDNLKRERLIQMRTLVQSVQDLVDGGRTALNMRKAAEIEHRRELIRGMMGDIDGGNDEKRTEREMEKRQEEGSFKKLATAGLGSFEYMAHRIDINHMSHDGWFYKTFVTGKHGVMEAENNYLRNMQESMDSLQSKTEEILGKSVEQVAEEQNKRYDSTGITLARQDQNGMEMPREEVRDLSKAEATYLWMVWKMPDGRAKMENEGYDERTMSEIREFIGDKNVAWTDWIQQEYLPGIFTRYNGRYQEMYGTPMMATENYVPLRYNGEDISEKADLSGDKVKFDTMQIKNGSMINRTQNLDRISRTTNAFNLICEHVNEAEEYTAFARVRKDLEDILNSKAVRNQLNANVAGQYNALREACSIAVHAFNEKISGVDRAVSVMTKGLIGANIAFRNSTALKQILSVPAFLGYSQDPRFIASFLKNVGVEYAKNAGAVASTMATFGFSYNKMMERIQKGNKGVTGTGLSKTIAWCVENMPSFRERVMKGNMGIEALENGGTDASQFEQMLDKYLQYGMNSNKLIDAITCSVGIKSIYDYRYARLKEQGMTDGEARRMALMEADIYYNGTQQSNHVAFMSPIQVSKTSVNRMLSVYQNASIGFARKFAESTQNLSKSVHVNRMIDTYASEYERDGMDAIEARAKAKDVVWNQIRKAAVSALIYGIGTNLIWDLGSRGLIGLFMSDDEKKKALAWTSLISYPMRGMPLFNAGASLISSAASIGTGEEAQMSEYNPMLLFASINDALQAVGRSAKDFGFLSPMTAVKVLDRGLSLAGFRPEIWANTVLGVTDLVKDGLIEGKDVDKMTDLMLLLQTPNSLRPSVAKTLYGIDEESMKEMSDEERKEAMSKYVKSIMYAMKYVDEGDWGMYVPGMKVLKADQRKKVIDGLIKEAIPEDILKSMEKEDKDLKKQLDTIRKTDELSKMFDEETDLEKKKQIGKKLKTEIKADEDAPVEEFVGNALDKYFLTVSPSKAQQTADAYMELSTSDDIREDLMVDKVYSQLKKSVIDPQEDLKGDALSEFKAAHEDDIKKYNKLKRLRSGVKKAKGISDYKSMLIKDGADKEELMQKIRELRKEALSVIGQ